MIVYCVFINLLGVFLDKISVHNMVKLTMKNNDVFGIEGYNIPRHEHPYYKGTLNMFPKTKGKNFAELAAAPTLKYPGPDVYNTSIVWGCASKKVNPTKKNTYID